ncbi:MAG: riboflavin synthase [Gammaproteobacteria bacterium]|nr:riboflavin synthase [Gammaproteobacteria bacterium]MCP5135794.1 riboflavin synthase [Gammaproteobacteria bacterium]
MFTGIIESVGRVAAMQPRGGDMRLRVQSGKLDLSDVVLGDSIATNGVCLTVIELPGDGYWADVSGESLRRTTLGGLSIGSAVNLEKALTPSTRLGGHLVSGHVDGVGEIVSIREDARSVRFQVKAPDALARYIAEKGSVCMDGVSLTVNSVAGAAFDLNIVPHTMQETTIHAFRVGTRVNLEVDIIARYLERLVLGDKAAESGAKAEGLTLETLARNGFL